jgi:hypothetical protein
MTPLRRQVAWLHVGTMLVIGITGEIAVAQDDVDVEERVEVNRDEALQNLRERQRQRLRLQAAYKSQFDLWVRTQFRTRDGARHQLEMVLARQVRTFAAECHLTADQVKKLELAGRGDIKRFMDRIDNIAKVIESPGSSAGDLQGAILEMNDLGAPVSQRLFGDRSLLCKTLAGSLDSDQAAEREKALAKRSTLRYQAAINSAIKLLRMNLGLREDQCTDLATLLLKETRAPRRFGDVPDIALVLFQASRISEEKIKPIFDDGQWLIVSRWMGRYLHGFVIGDELATRPFDRVKPVSKQDERKADRPEPSRLREAQP